MAKLAKQSTSPPPGQIKHDDFHFGTLDVSSYDTHGTASTADDELYFGDGNLPTNFNTAVDGNVELGLKVHYRQGYDILPTSTDSQGNATYNAPAGMQVVDPAHGVSSANANRAAWNFDFSVNTGLGGSAKTLADYDFRITIADDDGNTQVFELQHVAAGDTPWVNVTTGVATGPTPTAGSFADEDGANAQLSQNSVNFGFAFLKNAFGADALSAGEHYDITLQAFDDKGKIVTQVHDAIFLT